MIIAVYCSSREGLGPRYEAPAQALGQWIGQHGHTLIYGGVHAGLMHTVAQAAHDAGAHITGVVPERFKSRADALVDELVPCHDLAERKDIMTGRADLFVVLPGGIGTIDEWISTLSQIMVNGEHDHRGMIIVNTDNMYGPLLEQLRLTSQSPFARGKHIDMSVPVSTVPELIAALDHYADKE